MAEKHPRLTAALEAAAAISSIHLSQDGWRQVKMGGTRRVDYDYRFSLFVRTRDMSSLSGTEWRHSENVTKPEPAETAENKAFRDGVTDPYGRPLPCFDTIPKAPACTAGSDSCRPGEPADGNLPVLSDFARYPSLASLQTGSPCILIAYDSEWFIEHECCEPDRRLVMSWQFAVVWRGQLCEFVFLRKLAGHALRLETAIARILDFLGLTPSDSRKITKYESLGSPDASSGKRAVNLYGTYREALDNSEALFPDGRKVRARYCPDSGYIPVTLVCHAGKGDISAFARGKKRNGIDILRYCSEVQGGLVTLKPAHLYADSLNPAYGGGYSHRRCYPISLRIADTMCHAPAGMKSLEDIGKAVGWPKVRLPDGCIDRMDALMRDDPRLYFEYASNDSVVALFYISALYGYNRQPAVTVTSAAARVMKAAIMQALGVDSDRDFNHVYRGLKKVGHGLKPRDDRPGYVAVTSLEPISDRANLVQDCASKAYHGGYNSSSDIGYFPFMTWDYDLRNAYPTAMCLTPDIDWEDPIAAVVVNRPMTLHDFTVPVAGGFNPLRPFVGYVSFRFPETVKYPCIPVDADGIPVYPMSSDGLDGVYACGPEVYLALRLGAEIVCERGYFLNALSDPETGALSYSMRAAVKQLVADRAKAKAEHGKGSLEELVLKIMASSCYGKVSQSVVQKHTWSAFRDEMEKLGCSAVTNPFNACMITSIVRTELLAVQNMCHAEGYMACSVTTDGLISNVPNDRLMAFDLFGFRRFAEQARLYLTDGESSEIWEAKHWQDDLVNFTTRGNVSLSSHGVCAHNSAKSGFASDSYDDRHWLMKAVISRTGTVDYTDSEWTSFRNLVDGEDFAVRPVTRHIRMDFDLKRKPDRSSFVRAEVPLDGAVYEMACFTTVPFETVAEFRRYRQIKDGHGCLRTMADWELFWLQIDIDDAFSDGTDGGKPSDSHMAKTQTKHIPSVRLERGMKPRRPSTAPKKPRVMADRDTVLISCIKGHRGGLWNIPMLDRLSGQARLDWINSHRSRGSEFTADDWKNAGRASRQEIILPREMVEDKLNELINDTTAVAS